MIAEAQKKHIRFSLKLDSSTESIITGLRLKLDFSNARSQSASINLKLFNRTVPLQNYNNQGNRHSLWFDIPFCDAEALFGSVSANNLSLEIITDDPKGYPIRICSMEVFAMTKKDFFYKEKVKKLEKINAEKIAQLLTSSQSNAPES